MRYLIYLLINHITKSSFVSAKFQKGVGIPACSRRFFLSSIRFCSFQASLAYRPLVLVVLYPLPLCFHSNFQVSILLIIFFLRAYMVFYSHVIRFG